ncbi:MAG: c-type cytochrome [Anaerolineales bacterium]
MRYPRFLISIGIALLFAGLFFDVGKTQSSIIATPTPDRLAEPTLPPSPTQIDYGRHVYWLSCLPCHGDRGQGLTDEFRSTYPVEDQNCWKSGCHGQRPYDNGFTIPTYIPAVIGAGTLQKFETAASLHSYIHAAMPFWKPGSLKEDEAWQVTAFILYENKLWDNSVELNDSNASLVRVGPPQPTPTPQPVSSKTTEPYLALIIGIIVFALLFFVARILQKNKS